MGMQYVTTRPAEQQQSMVGVVALLMGMVILVGMLAAAGFGGQAFTLAVRAAGHTGNLADHPVAGPLETRFGFCLLLMMACWVLSLAPFILGIIGSRRHPRNMGITAIALAVMTPVLGFVVLLAFMVPMYGRYPT